MSPTAPVSQPSPRPPLSRLWPRTLVARLFLIFVLGLVVAHALSFSLLFYERYTTTRMMMLGDLERDVGIAMDILDRLPPQERAAWYPRLTNGNKQYLPGPATVRQPLESAAQRTAAAAIEDALGGRRPLAILADADDPRHIQAQVTLGDGSTAVLDIHLQMPALARWLPVVLCLQLLLLVGCAWLAVRLAVRPLTRLAQAADAMDPNRKPPPVPEDGPREVARAATAFNAMQRRIASHMAERMQMLGAISHDLQTPITRMKLRVESMDESADRDKLERDLDEVGRLVREGIDYARSAHGSQEKEARTDLGAFVESLVYDYEDTGRRVTLAGQESLPWSTRPQALRRVLSNLIDNALKFSGAAEVAMRRHGDGAVSIFVLDRGPGIPPGELDAVCEPFYRVESSRNRATGGTGLGLAIARQLAAALGAELVLSNRPGGGLSAELRLPSQSPRQAGPG
ncbi:ATP-binding protein [Achromobacter aloeverae]|uniref:histidine kinase n=1 Tax=Achromobacter aloeverae TaxID=1750518 RepID=A0A4Q1HHT8_9BURK|nr:HAMP domain-containing sensor histidine kinase [Achromobacter aloeverae]RXN86147.1 two-component sensor histidine kinase [Achromobacter aloeverae]